MKLLKLRALLIIFLSAVIAINAAYSQSEYVSKNRDAWASGYLFRLDIQGKKADLDLYGDSIVEILEEELSAAIEKALSCLPVSSDGKKCVRTAFQTALNTKQITIHYFIGSTIRIEADLGGADIRIWNGSPTAFWAPSKDRNAPHDECDEWNLPYNEEIYRLRYPLFEELLHIAGYDEDIAVGCARSKECYGCRAVPGYGMTSADCQCKEPDKKDGTSGSPQIPNTGSPSRPDNDHMDDNYSSASPRAVEGVYESLNPEVLVLKHGFWQEAGAYMNKLGKRFSYIEPDQSPFEMKDPPSILYIPSGGLYGLENSPQFKNILHDFVFRGGTVIVSSQQHGYEFKSLPGGENIKAHGWREDISCFIDSTFIDWWHPVFSRITEATISIPVDGYFTKIPDGSTILLSRTGKADAELFYCSFGLGTVVASSSFEDYVNWTSGAPEIRRAVFRDLLTWALAPRIAVPQYNLRNNPSPAVNLNVEVENRSEETASSAKIIWLTPDRGIVFEEERLVSLPAGGKIDIPLTYNLSNIPESDYGIWHVDYVLYGLDDQEVQSQREAATGRFSICLPSEEFIEAYKLFVEIQPEQTQAFQGSTIKFQVKISNRAEEAKRLHLYWGWGLQPPASYWEEVEVPPEGAITREITATLPYLIGDRLVEESISL